MVGEVTRRMLPHLSIYLSIYLIYHLAQSGIILERSVGVLDMQGSELSRN